MTDTCHLCGESNLFPLIDFGEHPIAHRFLMDPSEEEYVHSLVLHFCEVCGLIQIGNPVPPERLYTEYNWLSSWKPQPHMPRIIQIIEEFTGLRPTSKIVEVGSNDGTFLELLRNRGFQQILGVEPAKDATEAARSKGVETVGSSFCVEVAEEIASASGQCDLLVARQVLEHVSDLEDFQKAMVTLLRPEGYVLIEVPNFALNLTAHDYSAVWEEHVNYFTSQSLSRFLANVGIRIIHTETANFCGEAFIVLGKYENGSATPLVGELNGSLRNQVISYRDRWPEFSTGIAQYLKGHQEAGGKVAVYGAGCRACSLINFTDLGPYIDFIVDDQPEKQGKFMPGSRLPIMPRQALEDNLVDLCLLAVNAENEDKLIAEHQSYINGGGHFASICPPSDRLIPVWSKS